MAGQFAPLAAVPWPALDPDAVHLWQWFCPQAQDWVAPCWGWLDGAEQRRAGRFYRDRDRQQFILGRGGLRWLLGQYLQEPPAQLTFTYGPQGKPALTVPSLAFNLAHSGDWLLFAVTRRATVGVDIEVSRDRPRLEALIQRCLTPQEQATLPPEPAMRLERFLAYWTLKEAYLKALGSGLHHPMAAVEITWGHPPRLSQPTDPPWSFDHWSPQPGVWAALCVTGAAPRLGLGTLPGWCDLS